MKVGSLFAEIGFKVDQSGLDNFSNALKAFQKTIRSGIKELKEYAKAAREISQAIRDAYVPTTAESRSRYRAQTAHMRSQARVNNAWARRERSTSIAGAADSYLKAQRAKFFEQDSNTRALNALSRKRMLDQKENGLIGTHTGKATASLRRALAFVGGISSGRFFTALGSVFGTIPMMIGRVADAIVGAIFKAANWLGKTFMQGIRMGLAYRDYRTFTGRSAKGLYDLMGASFGTTNLSPEDIMRDAASFEKGYWDLFLGGGNPRAWQMLGIRPTGIGDVDMRNVLGAISQIPQKGLQRKMLSEFQMSEDYLNLMDFLQQNNPGRDFEEILDMVQDTMDSVSEANFALKRFSWELDAAKVSLVGALVDSGLMEVLKKLAPVINDTLIKGFKLIGELLPPFLEKISRWLSEKLMTPEEREQYKTAKYATSRGREWFYQNLGLFAGGHAAQQMWDEGNYFSGLWRGLRPGGMATDAEKIAYIADKYQIVIDSPEQLPKVFDMIQAREAELIRNAGGYNYTDASTQTVP